MHDKRTGSFAGTIAGAVAFSALTGGLAGSSSAQKTTAPNRDVDVVILLDTSVSMPLGDHRDRLESPTAKDRKSAEFTAIERDFDTFRDGQLRGKTEAQWYRENTGEDFHENDEFRKALRARMVHKFCELKFSLANQLLAASLSKAFPETSASTVHIIPFGSQISARPLKMTAGNAAEASRVAADLKTLKLEGSNTEILLAYKAARDYVGKIREQKNGRNVHVILITDGADNPAAKASFLKDHLKPLIEERAAHLRDGRDFFLWYAYLGARNAELQSSIAQLSGESVPIDDLRFGWLTVTPRTVDLGEQPAGMKWEKSVDSTILSRNCAGKTVQFGEFTVSKNIWESQGGRQVQADLLKVEGDRMIARSPKTGRIFDMAISKFSTEDQKYLREEVPKLRRAIRCEPTSIELKGDDPPLTWKFVGDGLAPGEYTGRIPVLVPNGLVIADPPFVDVRFKIAAPLVSLNTDRLSLGTLAAGGEVADDLVVTPDRNAAAMIAKDGAQAKYRVTLSNWLRRTPAKMVASVAAPDIEFSLHDGSKEWPMTEQGEARVVEFPARPGGQTLKLVANMSDGAQVPSGDWAALLKWQYAANKHVTMNTTAVRVNWAIPPLDTPIVLVQPGNAIEFKNLSAGSTVEQFRSVTCNTAAMSALGDNGDVALHVDLKAPLPQGVRLRVLSSSDPTGAALLELKAPSTSGKAALSSRSFRESKRAGSRDLKIELRVEPGTVIEADLQLSGSLSLVPSSRKIQAPESIDIGIHLVRKVATIAVNVPGGADAIDFGEVEIGQSKTSKLLLRPDDLAARLPAGSLVKIIARGLPSGINLSAGIDEKSLQPLTPDSKDPSDSSVTVRLPKLAADSNSSLFLQARVAVSDRLPPPADFELELQWLDGKVELKPAKVRAALRPVWSISPEKSELTESLRPGNDQVSFELSFTPQALPTHDLNLTLPQRTFTLTREGSTTSGPNGKADTNGAPPTLTVRFLPQEKVGASESASPEGARVSRAQPKVTILGTVAGAQAGSWSCKVPLSFVEAGYRLKPADTTILIKVQSGIVWNPPPPRFLTPKTRRFPFVGQVEVSDLAQRDRSVFRAEMKIPGRSDWIEILCDFQPKQADATIPEKSPHSSKLRQESNVLELVEPKILPAWKGDEPLSGKDDTIMFRVLRVDPGIMDGSTGTNTVTVAEESRSVRVLPSVLKSLDVWWQTADGQQIAASPTADAESSESDALRWQALTLSATSQLRTPERELKVTGRFLFVEDLSNRLPTTTDGDGVDDLRALSRYARDPATAPPHIRIKPVDATDEPQQHVLRENLQRLRPASGFDPVSDDTKEWRVRAMVRYEGDAEEWTMNTVRIVVPGTVPWLWVFPIASAVVLCLIAGCLLRTQGKRRAALDAWVGSALVRNLDPGNQPLDFVPAEGRFQSDDSPVSWQPNRRQWVGIAVAAVLSAAAATAWSASNQFSLYALDGAIVLVIVAASAYGAVVLYHRWRERPAAMLKIALDEHTVLPLKVRCGSSGLMLWTDAACRTRYYDDLDPEVAAYSTQSAGHGWLKIAPKQSRGKAPRVEVNLTSKGGNATQVILQWEPPPPVPQKTASSSAEVSTDASSVKPPEPELDFTLSSESDSAYAGTPGDSFEISGETPRVVAKPRRTQRAAVSGGKRARPAQPHPNEDDFALP